MLFRGCLFGFFHIVILFQTYIKVSEDTGFHMPTTISPVSTCRVSLYRLPQPRSKLWHYQLNPVFHLNCSTYYPFKCREKHMDKSIFLTSVLFYVYRCFAYVYVRALYMLCVIGFPGLEVYSRL